MTKHAFKQTYDKIKNDIWYHIRAIIYVQSYTCNHIRAIIYVQSYMWDHIRVITYV